MKNRILCIAGKNNIAIAITKWIRSTYPNIKVVAVCNKNDVGKNGFQLSYRNFCILNSIPILTLEALYNLENLIFLSLEFDRIIDPEKFRTKELFNIHFSLLPSYKGMYTSALPIIHNESYTGVTLHKIDRGIDTGNILDQERFAIGYTTTGQELYIKYIKKGTDLVKRNIDKILNQNYISFSQSYKNSSYFGKSAIDYSNLRIDLNKTALEIYNQIRAFSFPAFQLPVIKDCTIYHSKITANRSIYKPGTTIYEDINNIIISTIDYDLEMKKDRRLEMIEACRNLDEKLLNDFILNKYPLQQKTVEGWDALIVSVYNGHFNLAKRLIEELHWDINSMNNNLTTVAMYAMTHASNSNDSTFLEYLINEHTNINWNHIDAFGNDIYYYARKLNNPKVLKLLKCL